MKQESVNFVQSNVKLVMKMNSVLNMQVAKQNSVVKLLIAGQVVKNAVMKIHQYVKIVKQDITQKDNIVNHVVQVVKIVRIGTIVQLVDQDSFKLMDFVKNVIILVLNVNPLILVNVQSVEED